MNFEQAFSETENAAASAIKSASKLVSQAKALQQAAKRGKINEIRRAKQGISDELKVLNEEATRALQSWALEVEEEEQYLQNHYNMELFESAKNNLKIYVRNGRLVAPPLVVRILPESRAVTVGKKRIYDLRPSYLTDLLAKAQKKPASYNSKAFLKSLHTVYLSIVSRESNPLNMGSGHVVPLETIYKLLTALPGSSRSYDRTDFARDLYLLDTKGPKCTRTGAVVHFSTSTGARHEKGTFSFIGPDGQDVQYYGIRFDEVV